VKRLVYLAPVRWADFAQRPHKFVEWHHRHHGSRVLWVEPYPTRVPQWNDLRRLRGHLAPPGQDVPPWLDLLQVPAVPVEPLWGGSFVNGMLWKDTLARIAEFAAAGECELVLGKPSQLSLRVMDKVPFARTVYDAMDDLPAFQRGLSARAMEKTELAVARRVQVIQASATKLVAKFSPLSRATALVRNACDPDTLPPFAEPAPRREAGLVGYVGMLASWFDWELVIALARARSGLRFLIIGPQHLPAPAGLPSNIELRPACAHPVAMREMARFSVGLIPFRNNRITSAVDPVKYYEYRGLGVPVLTTTFGEMPEHAREDAGVFLAHDADTALAALDAAMAARTGAGWVEAFRQTNSWDARFAAGPLA
jgi:glycosyltransferase involved in cell wall biosynthesis